MKQINKQRNILLHCTKQHVVGIPRGLGLVGAFIGIPLILATHRIKSITNKASSKHLCGIQIKANGAILILCINLLIIPTQNKK